MDEHEPNGAGGSELWHRYRDSSRLAEEIGPIDANTLAAYLDGRASPAECEKVERAMAADPELLEDVRNLRELAAQGPEHATPALVRRAKAALGRQRVAEGVPVVLRPRVWWSPVVLRLASAAALVVIVSLVGYYFGRDFSRMRDARDARLAAISARVLTEEPEQWEGIAWLGNGGKLQ